MQNSKLYSILEDFNKYEQNRIRKFLVSPYFNKNESLVQLFDLVTEHINGGDGAELDKELLWQVIYPETDYDDVLFRKNSSDLLKLVESYLAQQVYEGNPIHKSIFLIEAVSNRNIEKLYNSSIRTARRLTDQQNYRDSNFYLSQYQLERIYHELLDQIRDRTEKRNLEKILDNLDRFFLSEKLRYYCTVLSRKTMVTEEYKLLFIEEIVSLVKKFDYENVPPVAIYYQIYLTHVEVENTEHYYRLMDLLVQYGDLFPKNETEYIYTHALNYCVKKLNQGSQEFLEEYFNVFVILLDKELLLVDGVLSPWHFRNIIVIALRLGKTEWTENFIYSYKKYLPEASRDNAVTFNLAQLYFYQKRYGEVVQLLHTVDYEDFIYNLNSKTLLIQAFYEMDEIEPLFSLLESFRTYLNRHKDIPAARRKHYHNLIRFTKKLTKIIAGNQKDVTKFNKDLETVGEGNIASVTWLKEKIAELE